MAMKSLRVQRYHKRWCRWWTSVISLASIASRPYCDAFVPSSVAFVHSNISTTKKLSLHLAMSPPSINTIPPNTSPLSPFSFAGKVEAALVAKFGEEPIRRVLDSWRWADMDYEHRQFVGPLQEPPSTDPELSNCHQLAPSYVAGLTCRQFWDESKFDWSAKLKDSFVDIKNEFLREIADMDALASRGNNVWAGALTNDAAGYGEGWKTLVLVNRGMWDEANAQLFPKTSRAVYEAGVPATEVFFASMQPGSDIKLHSDFTNFVLTSHLALVIPENGNNKCRLIIGDETRQWLEGEVNLFDTSIMHSAVNEAEEVRYILMFRVWHPDLTDIEREALQFIYDCLEMPGLLSENAGTRWSAEERIKTARTFPEIVDGTKKKRLSKKSDAGFAFEGRRNKGKNRGKKKGGSSATKGFGA